MDNQNRDQLYKYFNETIRTEADIEINALRAEIDKMHHEAEVIFEKAMKEDQANVLDNARIDASRDFQMRLTAKKHELNLKIKEKRQLLLDELFEKLRKRLIEFRQSPAYRKWIDDHFQHLNPKEYTAIEIDPNDQILLKRPLEFKIIKSQGLIAGFKLHHHNGKVILDESFATKIEEAKQWFFDNSLWFSEPEATK